MKTTLLFFFIIVSITAFSQKATIKLKSGEVKEVEITANSNSSLFTTAGNINYVDIESISFVTLKPSEKSLEEKLLAAGIKVTVGGNVMIPVPSKAIVAINQVDQKNTLDQVVYSLEKFRKQRTTGKALQLLGAVAAGTALILSVGDPDEVTKNQDLIKGLAIGGAGISTIGFAIDLGAGHHLRFKH